MAQKNWKDLDALKRANAMQTLMKVARLVDERATGLVNEEAGRPMVRPAHTRLFPYIDKEGTRLTELARRVGITKQAVAQLVDELASHGVVELAPDPSDGRARLIRFTPKGLEAIAHGLGVLQRVEGEFARKLGKERLRSLHETLLEMQKLLEEG